MRFHMAVGYFHRRTCGNCVLVGISASQQEHNNALKAMAQDRTRYDDEFRGGTFGQRRDSQP